jgi:hypothetical protein
MYLDSSATTNKREGEAEKKRKKRRNIFNLKFKLFIYFAYFLRAHTDSLGGSPTHGMKKSF